MHWGCGIQAVWAELGQVLGEGNGTPLQYSCLENPMDGGAWWAAVHGVARSWTRLSDFTLFSLSCIGEGNGNPLQCSCLENPRDGGAWWAAIYGVAQSRTQLKRLGSSSSQYSCLKNSMDRGAWQVTVHWVTKSQTWLSMPGSYRRKDIQKIAFRHQITDGNHKFTSDIYSPFLPDPLRGAEKAVNE